MRLAVPAVQALQKMLYLFHCLLLLAHHKVTAQLQPVTLRWQLEGAPGRPPAVCSLEWNPDSRPGSKTLEYLYKYPVSYVTLPNGEKHFDFPQVCVFPVEVQHS